MKPGAGELLLDKLSEKLGDVATQRILRSAAALGGVPAAVGARLLISYIEYVREENAMLADAAQTRLWCEQIAALQQDLDKLEQRIRSME